MLLIRAGYFTVICDATAGEVASACKKYADSGQDFLDIESQGKSYRLKDVSWDAGDKILTGTMLRLRMRNLPEVVTADDSHKGVEGKLGERASFAYMPSSGEALLQYNQHGPRHTQLQAFLLMTGVPNVSSVSPAVAKDALEQLAKAPLVRRVEYSLADRDSAPLPIASEDPAVADVLGMLRRHAGYSIHVEISMGRRKGGLTGAKELIEKLLGMVWGVQSVKASVKENAGQAPRLLDMLSGRLAIDLNVPESGNQIDHAFCRSRLRGLLKDRVTTSEEAETEEDEDDVDPADTPPPSPGGMD